MKNLFAWLIFSFALWSNFDDGVEAISMGRAYRAVALSNDTIFYNPAGLIKNRTISPGFDYIRYFAREDHAVGVSLKDAKTADWALGLAYSTKFRAHSKVFSNHHAHLAFAMPVVTDSFALGMSTYYDYNPVFANAEHRHFFNTSLGFLASTPVGLSLALVLDRLLGRKGQEPHRSLSLAASMDFSEVSQMVPLKLALDWTLGNLTPHTELIHDWAVGLEYYLLAILPFRMGVRSDSKNNKNYLSLGTGLGVKYADILGFFEQDLKVGKNRNIGFSLRFNL